MHLSFLLSYLRKFPFDQGKSRMARWQKKYPENPVLFTDNLGHRFELNTSEYVMRQLWLYGAYEKNTIRHLLKLLPDHAVCADVGANIGYYSLTLGGHVKNGKVFAFEPNPVTFGIFTRNLSLNPGIKTVEPIQKGLAEKRKNITLSFNQHNLGAASAFGNNEETATVEITTLDDFCREKNISRIDLVKVDIEGGELNFLKGAEEIISKSPKMILVTEIIDSHCRRAGYTAKELFDYITSLGFKPFLPKAWPFSLKKTNQLPENYFDNIIFLKGY
ncbi:MAG: FkbM family methyltransferase [Bacteroidota bacterium]